MAMVPRAMTAVTERIRDGGLVAVPRSASAARYAIVAELLIEAGDAFVAADVAGSIAGEDAPARLALAGFVGAFAVSTPGDCDGLGSAQSWGTAHVFTTSSGDGGLLAAVIAVRQNSTEVRQPKKRLALTGH